MESVLCYACGADLSEKKKDRRRLGSSESSHVVATLSDLLNSVNVGSSSSLSIQELAAGYVCKSCFRDLEKYKKLHEQLISNAKKSPHSTTRLTSAESSERTFLGSKRGCPQSTESSVSKVPRLSAPSNIVVAPTVHNKDTGMTIVPPKSPQVAVS